MSASIDTRELQGPPETILTAFDALAPGERVVVVGDGAPGELLRQLQSSRRGQFEWSPLEAGPRRFRTEITRRAAAAGSRRDVTEALAWDHDRLDTMEKEAFERLAGGDSAGAQAAWAAFSFGLRRHIRFEEEILFPTFEQRAGFPPAAGPTAVMRAEHREIEALLDRIGEGMRGQDAPNAARAGGARASAGRS